MIPDWLRKLSHMIIHIGVKQPDHALVSELKSILNFWIYTYSNSLTSTAM